MRTQDLILAILLSACLFPLFAYSFPGEDVDMFIGAKVVADENNTWSVTDYPITYHGYKRFYNDFNEETKKLSRDRPFPIGPEWDQVTDSEKLESVEFVVTDYYEVMPSGYNAKIEYALKLENAEFGTIYYRYDPLNESSLEIEVVGGLDLPEDYYCSDITKIDDKFTGEITYRSPYLSGIGFSKVVRDTQSDIYMSISTSGLTCSVMKNGAYLLFDNGEQIKWPQAVVSTDAGSGYFRYRAFVKLNPNDLELLKNHLLTDVRLYIYDSTISRNHARRLKAYIGCLMKYYNRN